MSPTLPKRPRSMDQLPSTGWFDLPFEMREIVIDKMDPQTRCRFAQCSKMCEYEAKKSKNYMYKMTLMHNRNNGYKMELHLCHRKDSVHDFWLQFLDVGDQKTLVIYKSHKENDWNEVRWREFENGYPEDVRLNYLNEYMEKYKNSIRVFVFDDDVTLLNEFNVKSLKNLEKIDFKDIRNFDRGVVECGFIGREQLLSIKHLNFNKFRIPFDQTADFKGETLLGGSIGFDEKQINKYLIMLKNGESRQNLKHIKLEFDYISRVESVARVIRGLDVIAQYSSRNLRNDWSDSDDSEDDEDFGRYTFNFPSKNRENGKFYVVFEPRLSLEIKWEPTE